MIRKVRALEFYYPMSRVKVILAAVGIIVVFGKFKAIKKFLLNLFFKKELLKTIPWLKVSVGGRGKKGGKKKKKKKTRKNSKKGA